MANTKKTDQELLAELDQQAAKVKEQTDKKLAQLKARKKAIIARQSEAERKARNHRLIEIGAAVEHYAGQITDLAAFNEYLKNYGYAIARTQQKKDPPVAVKALSKEDWEKKQQ